MLPEEETGNIIVNRNKRNNRKQTRAKQTLPRQRIL